MKSPQTSSLSSFILQIQSHTCALVLDQYYLYTRTHLNFPLHLNIILSCTLADDGKPAWEPAEPGVAGNEICYHACGGLWLLSSDREASLARRRGATIRFVDCSAFWHVEVIEGNTFLSAARQLMWSYIFWHIPSVTYYLRTRQSVWSLLALYSGQVRDTFRRYFIFKRISS